MGPLSRGGKEDTELFLPSYMFSQGFINQGMDLHDKQLSTLQCERPEVEMLLKNV